MILHRWGLICYEEARKKLDEVHARACCDGQNHLILCSHPLCYTVGSDDPGGWSVPTIPTDRGGSITCHSPGQLVTYFCFQAREPIVFYRKVRRAYDAFFAKLLPSARYDTKHPGWYIENRKIASLGFRYRNGVSLHGVSLNVDVDLEAHNRVAPCNLDGIIATSLLNEGVLLDEENLSRDLVFLLSESFDDPSS
ncbi:lipoyl protein ligase domain-containing protein [Nitratifractor sp.]